MFNFINLVDENKKNKRPLQEITHSCDSRSTTPMDSDQEIVISGISGRFPSSDNMKQFCDNITYGIDFVTANCQRWTLDCPEASEIMGKVNNVTKFDAQFFDILPEQADIMDPTHRMILEHVYEAIVDAGINPRTLRGTKTGVFVGTCFTERQSVETTGCFRDPSTNVISAWLGVTGPSCIVDSARSSSLLAMDKAYWAIRSGLCDAALVGGISQLSHSDVLTPNRPSKSFDTSTNGCLRSEAISVIHVQKSKDAKRIYGTVVYAKSNCDGFKEEGNTFPSNNMQSQLLRAFYDECKISPSSVQYIETYGTGTVGDSEEIKALDKIFSPNREELLKISSVMSVMGHIEGASGICQIAKAIIANETGIIPPSAYNGKSHEGAKAFKGRRLQLVTEPTAWNGGYIGINSLGCDGSHTHVLLKSHSKEKIDGGSPQDDLPRLVLVSGRTEKAVECILSDVNSRPLDAEYVRLLHSIHAEDISGHPYRGYTIFTNPMIREHIGAIDYYSGVKRPICFVFSGTGPQRPGIGTELLRFPVFAAAIQKCNEILQPRGVDVYSILANPQKIAFDNILDVFIGVVALQIGLIDLLTALEIVPDVMIGNALGEIGCAYADGCLTVKQAILAAYYGAIVFLQTDKNQNFMAPDLESEDFDGVTSADIIITNKTSTETFLEKLTRYMERVISKPKVKNPRWFSTSVLPSQLTSSQENLFSAAYLVSNAFCPLLIEDIILPENAILIEITSCGLSPALLKKHLDSGVTNIALFEQEYENTIDSFLEAVGELYTIGLQPAIWKLYPEIQFPISKGTPMISPLIKWEHSEEWSVHNGSK